MKELGVKQGIWSKLRDTIALQVQTLNLLGAAKQKEYFDNTTRGEGGGGRGGEGDG